MKITEPTTALTDYILAIETIFLGILLLRNVTALPVKLWAFSFFILAGAAIAGGTYHGFIESLDPATSKFLWKITLYCVGVATFLMLSASILAFLHQPWKAILLSAAVAQVGLYLLLVSRSNDFKLVIYDYVPAMIVIVIMATLVRFPGTLWLLTAVGFSFVGALIQRSGFSLHKNFNFNDLYHVIQMVGMYFFYRAGKLL